MTHDPKAVEVLAVGMGTSTIKWAMDALTAADLSIVGEGQARIGGKVVRLVNTGIAYDPDQDRARYEDDPDHDADEHGDCAVCQPLYVAIQDEGDEG